jgi:hypothetical protein
MWVIQNRQKGEGFYYGIMYHGEVGYYPCFALNLNVNGDLAIQDSVKIYDTYEKARFDFYYLVEVHQVDLGYLEIVPVRLEVTV